METQKVCENCGEDMKEIQYQARSADEAQRTIYKCFDCPLDSSRLDFSSPPSVPSSVWSSPRHRRESTQSTPLPARYISTRYILKVPMPSGAVDDVGFQPYECRRVTITGARGSTGSIYRLPHAAELMERNPYGDDMQRCVMKYSVLSPGAWGEVEALDEYRVDEERVQGTLYVAANFLHAPNVGARKSFYLRIPKDRCMYLCCELIDVDDDYWDAVKTLHSIGNRPSTLFDLMEPSTVGRLSNLSPRAWDSPPPTTSNYIYTSKIDGQRMWILMYGRMCYYVSRLGRREVMGWWMCDHSAGRRDIPLIVDVEFAALGMSALIDVLVDMHGTIAPVSRDMRWVLECWRDIRNTAPDIPVFMRNYFESIAAAKEYAKSEGRPCDGVVAIGLRSTEALKIKDIRSMELELRGKQLLSSDGDPVLSYDTQGNFSDGDILEVRFSFDKTKTRVSAHEVFKRTDKTIANSTSVCKDIMSCALREIQSPGDIQRRVAVTWCQELRGKILSMAWGTKRDGNIILDLGAGDGQSLDTLRTHEHGSYVLVEPDREKCERLARRIGVRRIHTDPMSLIATVQSLQRGSQRYAVVQCLAEQLLECSDLMKHLTPRIRCVTATFSAQFCVSALDICSAYGIPFIGCCYLYDSVKVGEYLLDVSDVTMFKTSSTLASVKWGGDTTYTEPAISSKNFNGISRVSKASSVRKLPEIESDRDANIICSKVHVITSI